MAKITVDELKNRVETAVREAQKLGCIVKQDMWLEIQDGKLCGCPLALTLLVEKGPEVARQLTYLADPSTEDEDEDDDEDDAPLAPEEFVRDQLGLQMNEVYAFTYGFDSKGVDALVETEPQHELEIYNAANEMRKTLIKEE